MTTTTTKTNETKATNDVKAIETNEVKATKEVKVTTKAKETKPTKTIETTNATTNDTNAITINQGKCQFNVKTAKQFRDTLAKWSDAKHSITQEKKYTKDRIDNLKGLLDTNNDYISRLENGEKGSSTKSIDELRTENEQFQKKIELERQNLSEYEQAQKIRYEKGDNLATKDLYNAYIIGNDTYIQAISKFLQDNGVTPCNETVTRLSIAIGMKESTSNQEIETNKHNSKQGFNKWRRLFIGELCDIITESLGGEWYFKFTYVLKKNRTK